MGHVTPAGVPRWRSGFPSFQRGGACLGHFRDRRTTGGTGRVPLHPCLVGPSSVICADRAAPLKGFVVSFQRALRPCISLPRILGIKFDCSTIIIVAIAIIIALWTHGPIRSKRSCAIFIAAIIVAAGSSSFRGAPGESAAPNGRRSPRAPSSQPSPTPSSPLRPSPRDGTAVRLAAARPRPPSWPGVGRGHAAAAGVVVALGGSHNDSS